MEHIQTVCIFKKCSTKLLIADLKFNFNNAFTLCYIWKFWIIITALCYSGCFLCLTCSIFFQPWEGCTIPVYRQGNSDFKVKASCPGSWVSRRGIEAIIPNRPSECPLLSVTCPVSQPSPLLPDIRDSKTLETPAQVLVEGPHEF